MSIVFYSMEHRNNEPSEDSKERFFEELARVGSAFANPKRFQLIGLLAQGERSVEMLSLTAGMRVTTVSAHLQTLKSVGLVTTRRSGTHIFYRLSGDDVAAAFVAVRDLGIARSPAGPRLVHDLFIDADGAEVTEVGRDELLERAQRNVAVIDVRPHDEFTGGHLPGAVSIPLDQLAERLDDIDPDQEIVAYCRGLHCVMADEAVLIARARGRSASRMQGGYIEWRSENRPVAVPA